MTAEELTDVILINPAGEAVEQQVHTEQTDDKYFPGARQYTMTLDQPEAGEWELDLQSEADNAYLLMTDFETAAGNGLMMHATKKDATPSQDLQLDYQLDVDGEKIDEESLTTTYHVMDSSQQEDTNTWYVGDRKSTRLNSSHVAISYAVFCLK